MTAVCVMSDEPRRDSRPVRFHRHPPRRVGRASGSLRRRSV